MSGCQSLAISAGLERVQSRDAPLSLTVRPRRSRSLFPETFTIETIHVCCCRGTIVMLAQKPLGPVQVYDTQQHGARSPASHGLAVFRTILTKWSGSHSDKDLIARHKQPTRPHTTTSRCRGPSSGTDRMQGRSPGLFQLPPKYLVWIANLGSVQFNLESRCLAELDCNAHWRLDLTTSATCSHEAASSKWPML